MPGRCRRPSISLRRTVAVPGWRSTQKLTTTFANVAASSSCKAVPISKSQHSQNLRCVGANPNPFPPEPQIDTSKRYDVYCIEPNREVVVYRNALFKGEATLLPHPGGRGVMYPGYIESEQANGQSMFLPRISIIRFCERPRHNTGWRGGCPPTSQYETLANPGADPMSYVIGRATGRSWMRGMATRAPGPRRP